MKVSFVARLVALALITLGAVSQAQMTNFTAPIEIASGPVSERGLVLDPGIAVDTDGTVYVVYADLKDNKDVWLRTLRGTPLAAGAPVNVSNTPKISIQPEVAVSGGRVCVAWQEGDPGSLEISVACSDDGGKTFGAGINVSKSPSVDSGVITLSDGVWDGNLDIAMDKNKNIYVVWADDRDLRFSKSSDGKTFSDPITLPQGSSDVRYPHAEVGPDSALYISYNEPGEQASDILVLKSTDGGNTFSKDPVFATTNRGFSDASEMALDANNTLYVVNDDTTNNPDNADINFSVSADRGATFQDKGSIAKDGAFPSIATDGKNLFVAFWDIVSNKVTPTGFVYSTDGGKTFTRKDIPNSGDAYGFLELDTGINISDAEVAASPAQGGKSGTAYIVWARAAGRDGKILLTTFTP